MKYHVFHGTTYRYSRPVSLCHNQVHLTPRTTPRQRCLQSSVEISPTPSCRSGWTDYFGNEVQFLSVGKTLPKTSSWADASFDICFVMRLEDKAAMDRYAKNPVHQKAAQEVFLPLSQKILFYDFTSE